MPETPFVFPNDPNVPWSIMIVLYPYITGLVAGAFVVSALYHVFRQEVLKPVARLALVTALCFCALATLPLLLHLHHPERAFNIMFTPNTTSAMSGFGFIYNFYMLLLVVEVWLVFRPSIVERANSRSGAVGLFYRILSLGVREISDGARRIDAWVIRFLAMIGIPATCVLHGYVGFLFGAVKANPVVVNGTDAGGVSGLGRCLGHRGADRAVFVSLLAPPRHAGCRLRSCGSCQSSHEDEYSS